MGKAVGNDVALSLFLQAVIADGFGGQHRFLNVFCFEDIVIDGVVSPNTGEAVGLQFELTERALASFLPTCCCILWTLGRMPSRF